MPCAADVLALLDAFAPGSDQVAARSTRLVRELIGQSPEPFSRHQFDPGHITASGLVLSPDARAVLLVFHRRLGRWLQPGGHVEPDDPSLEATARREVGEETGARLLADGAAMLVGVDVHSIPASRGEPAHQHYDFAFRFVAAGRRLEPDPEHQARWVDIAHLDQLEPDGALQRSLARALQKV